MASLYHHVKNIANIAASGPQPVSSKISDELIAFWISEVRSMFISQAIKNRQDISDTWYQTFCIDLIEVDASECCDITTDCKILRSSVRIPRSIEFDGDNLIKSVTSVDGVVINKFNRFRQKYTKFSKYTSSKPGWFLKDDYIYIINSTLEKAVVSIIAEDPLDLADFVDCNNATCFTWDSEYPMSRKMSNDVANYILNTKLKTMLSIPNDSTNDSMNYINITPTKK